MPIRTKVTIQPQSGSNIEVDGLFFEVCPKPGDDIVIEIPSGQTHDTHAARVKKVVHYGRVPGAAHDPYVHIKADKI